MTKRIFTFLVLVIASQGVLSGATTEEAPAPRAQRMAWFKEARFGMFIHWGVYSVLGGTYQGAQIPGIGEWIMQSAAIPVDEYETYGKMFNPQFFNAEDWVRIAKAAGMKYIVITSKHHDGFALWDSKASDWNIVDASPFGRDVLKELAEACRKHDLRLCFYYSIMDWHHPDAQAAFYPWYNSRELTSPSFRRYIDNKMKPQLNELLTEYGDIGILWFDGEWIADYTSEMGKEIDAYVRSLQPDIIVNNRVDKGRQGMEGLNREGDFAGDYGTPEQEIPDTGLEGVDWESCMTMNDTWGWKFADNNWKSSEELIRNLVDIVSKGGNYLLNVGPTPEGYFPRPSVERLKIIGDWLRVNGEAIYGTQASPFKQPVWKGRYTVTDDAFYAIVFERPVRPDGWLKIPEPDGFSAQSKAVLLATGEELEIKSNQGMVYVGLPDVLPDPIASVIKITPLFDPASVR
ncbi:MAG TPA: alpha-L-fucosidase [Oceanipulchritudo sp.]|nr:alpha-L-fucosidase [Oceanipulchritudo sp.]